MSIHIDSCAAHETVVVNTRSSVYELIVLGAPDGEVLVRGGGHFPEFRRVLFLGSTVERGSLQPRTIETGNRMQFLCGDRLITTSAVQSVSRRPPCTALIGVPQSSDGISRLPENARTGSGIARTSLAEEGNEI